MMHQTHSPSEQTGPGLGSRLLLTLTLGLLLAAAWRRANVTHALRAGRRHDKLPRRLQTWEGEGGRPIDSDDDHQRGRKPQPLPRSSAGDRLTH